MLSTTSLDTLLSLLSSPDQSFAQLLTSFRQQFPSSSSSSTTAASSSSDLTDTVSLAFQARCSCCQLVADSNAAEQSATLRPPQRLAALFLLAHTDDTVNDVQHLVQLSKNPFLALLLQQLDRCESLLPSPQRPASSIQLSHALLERRFLLQLLLPSLYASDSTYPLDSESPRSWTDRIAKSVMSEPMILQSSLNSSSPLAATLIPIRSLVQIQTLPSSLSISSPNFLTELNHLRKLFGDSLWTASIQSVASISSLTSFSTAPPLLDLQWTALIPELGCELSWMKWDPPADLNWDIQLNPSAPLSSPAMTNLLNPALLSTPIGQLLSKAMKSQLLATERTQLLNELKAGSTVGTSTNSLELSSTLQLALQLVPPTRLSQLVEKNHEIAREFLLQYMTLVLNRATQATASSHLTPLPYTINDYLSQLVQMDMSLHSMELVKNLSLIDQIALPADFFHLYISQCLTSCSKLQDKFLQNRHVRLICVFLQALIRHKMIALPPPTNGPSAESTASTSSTSSSLTTTSTANASTPSSSTVAPSSAVPANDVRDVLFVEVESFLVEFSRIKEAANLYKQIKQLEAS